MEDFDDELREIKREIIESRGLIIKTNNLTNALAADIKSIAKRQHGYERRLMWNSATAYIVFVIVVFVLRAFYSAWTGRAWTAIALNPRLAESVGVNVFRFRLLSFVTGSALVGLIGSFYAHYTGFLSPNTFGIWENINLQIFAILGGLGYPIAGPLLGSAVMTLLTESMRSVKTIAPAAQGAILVLLILFLPTGLLGLLQMRNSARERGAQVYAAASAGVTKLLRQRKP